MTATQEIPTIQKKRKKIDLSYLCSVVNGKLVTPTERLRSEISQLPDCENLVLAIREEKTPKTYEQIKAFHGTVCEQAQACYLEQDGEFMSLDKVKQGLKEQFLVREKQYYNDGTPVMLKLPHPERKGVFYEYHYEALPSLADLSIEQMRSFIDSIIAHFLHDRGFQIVIEKPTK